MGGQGIDVSPKIVVGVGEVVELFFFRRGGNWRGRGSASGGPISRTFLQTCPETFVLNERGWSKRPASGGPGMTLRRRVCRCRVVSGRRGASLKRRVCDFVGGRGGIYALSAWHSGEKGTRVLTVVLHGRCSKMYQFSLLEVGRQGLHARDATQVHANHLGMTRVGICTIIAQGGVV